MADVKTASFGPMTMNYRNLAREASTSDANTVEQYTVEPSEGAVDKITKSEGVKEEVMADYYRYGKYEVVTDKKTNRKSLKFTVQPRTLSPFTRGLESTIKVVKEKQQGKTQKEENLIPPFTKFILETVQEATQERSQVIETFGDFYVFFFGERPPLFTYSGTLINAKNVNWMTEFYYYYQNYLRGTQCARQSAKLIMRYNNVEIEGYMLNASVGMTADNEARIPFTFTCVVTKRKDILLPDDFQVKEKASDRKLVIRQLLGRLAGKEGAGTSDPKVSSAYAATTGVLKTGQMPQKSQIISERAGF